jgi:hypothetical protein
MRRQRKQKLADSRSITLHQGETTRKKRFGDVVALASVNVVSWFVANSV